MCVHNCRGLRSLLGTNLLVISAGGVGGRSRDAKSSLSRLLFVVFDAGEASKIIENQYLSQSPLEIFSSFFSNSDVP